MLLRMALPHLETNLIGGRVVAWHVREGEAVGYGDPLCDVSIEDRLVLRGKASTRADRLARLARRGREATTPEYRVEKGRIALTYRVISSDQAVVRHLRVAEGDHVEVGDVLGLVTTDPDEAMPEEDRLVNEAPVMRLVATLAEGDVLA